MINQSTALGTYRANTPQLSNNDTVSENSIHRYAFSRSLRRISVMLSRALPAQPIRLTIQKFTLFSLLAVSLGMSAFAIAAPLNAPSQMQINASSEKQIKGSLPAKFTVQFTLPDIQQQPYHRPYVAVWIETPSRQPLHTLAFWHEQSDWYKDLRQWWRKIGRKQTQAFDAASGATRKPGTYTLTWDATLNSGEQLPAGEYVLHLETAREKGSREYLRLPFSWSPSQPLKSKQANHYQTAGKTELGNVHIYIQSSTN